MRPLGGGVPDLRPRYLKNGAHADPHGTAVQRIAAGGSYQHGIDAQRGGGAEDGAHIGGVCHGFQYGNAAGRGT